MPSAPPAGLVTVGLVVLLCHRPSVAGTGHRPALMGTVWDRRMGRACRRAPHQRRARAAYPFSPVRFRLPGWTISQSPEVHQTAGASSTAQAAHLPTQVA